MALKFIHHHTYLIQIKTTLFIPRRAIHKQPTQSIITTLTQKQQQAVLK